HLRARIERVADADAGGAARENGHHLVVEASVDEGTRARDAGLPGGREDSSEQTGFGLLQVGVGEDNGGALAAELERHPCEAGRGARAKGAPSLNTAGEGNLGDVRMVD